MAVMQQIKAEIPRDLKYQVGIVLAKRDQKFAHWLREQLTRLVEEDRQQGAVHDPRHHTNR